MSKPRLHHYVPQFHLRNFTCEYNQRFISLYHLDNNLYVSQAAIRKQACKPSFYGAEPDIEESLSHIEGAASTAIKVILATEKTPNIPSTEHADLLYYVLSLSGRTVGAANRINDSFSNVFANLFSDSRSDTNRLGIVINNAHFLTLSNSLRALPMVIDLTMVFIRNRTPLEFICSDSPVVKLNRLMQTGQLLRGGLGYASTGFTMLVPLSKDLYLYLFDNNIYKCGDRNSGHLIELFSKDEVHRLNVIQACSANQVMFAGSTVSEEYLGILATEAKKSKASAASLVEEYESVVESDKSLLVTSQVPVTDLWVPLLHVHKHRRREEFNSGHDCWRNPTLVRYFSDYNDDKSNDRNSLEDFFRYAENRQMRESDYHFEIPLGSSTMYRRKPHGH